jgi:hypothetical protein
MAKLKKCFPLTFLKRFPVESPLQLEAAVSSWLQLRLEVGVADGLGHDDVLEVDDKLGGGARFGFLFRLESILIISFGSYCPSFLDTLTFFHVEANRKILYY